MPAYVTADELLEAGLPDTLTTIQLEAIARRASVQIEAYTRRWFYPREMTLLLDGTGGDILQVGPPIIAVFEVRLLAPALVTVGDNTLVEATSVRVYNRHLTQGLNDPDDRNNPKIQYLQSNAGTRRSPNIWPSGYFPYGVQNVQVHGLFGYTELDDPATLWTDGITPVGVTPEIIKLACTMLAARDTRAIGDVSGRVSDALTGYVNRERTRDQEIAYSTPNKSSIITNAAGIQGNPDIQALLKPYCSAQGALGAV